MKKQQSFKVVQVHNQPTLVEIERYGTVNQIEIQDRLYKHGVISWKARCASSAIRLSDQLLDKAINQLNLYPPQF